MTRTNREEYTNFIIHSCPYSAGGCDVRAAVGVLPRARRRAGPAHARGLSAAARARGPRERAEGDLRGGRRREEPAPRGWARAGAPAAASKRGLILHSDPYTQV